MSFIAELRRRNVFRVATAYIVVSWLIMQVVDVLQPALLMPAWVASLFAVILLIGFPIALILSWIYDITPDGVVRTEGSSPPTSRRLDLLIVSGLVTVGGLILWQQLHSPAPAKSAVNVPGSIAVLPFEDLSPAGDQQYFADGISEEILNRLAADGRLQVSGRTSSFSFRDTTKTADSIGAALGVDALLEGSLRKQGNQVRVVARLIDATTGNSLWSQTYNDKLSDIFYLQDRIASEVLSALPLQLGAATDQPSQNELRSRERASVAAYDLYLQAHDLIMRRDQRAVLRALDLLKRAVELDPDFAELHAEMGLNYRLLSNLPGGLGPLPPSEAIPAAKASVARARTLNPDSSNMHAVQGLLHLDARNLEAAEISLRRSLAINPANTNARIWLSLVLTGDLRYNAALEANEAAFAIDPLTPPSSFNLATAAIAVGDHARAQRVADNLLRREAPTRLVEAATGLVEQARGNVAAALVRADQLFANDANVVNGANAALMRIRIGDAAGALRYGLPFPPVEVALHEGRDPDAVAAAFAVMNNVPNVPAFERLYVETLAFAGEDERLLEFYSTAYGSIDGFEEALFWPFDADLPPLHALAYAMHRSGRVAELPRLLAQWRALLDRGTANGANNYFFDLSEARWQAISGNLSAAVEALRKAAGWRRGLLEAKFHRDYLVTLLDGQPGIAELMAENARRVNEERSKLGLDELAF